MIPREALLDVYRRVLVIVDGGRLVQGVIDRYPVDGPVRLVAIGKAAAAMARGAQMALGDRIEAALIITKHGHGYGLPGLRSVTLLEAGHPVPDEASLRAGQALLDFLAGVPAGDTMLFLISGGTSALVEAPRPGIGLAELQRAHRWLLGSGLAIDKVNEVRRRLSRIKGGGLRTALRGDVRIRQILLSDVPGDEPWTIGSGLLAPPSDPVPLRAGRPLPDWLLGMIAPGGGHVYDRGHDIVTHMIPGAATVREAACAAARARGLAVRFHEAPLSGEAAVVGRRLSAEIAAGPPDLLHVWSGETVVTLPERPGRGGRCQSLALAAAREMDGRRGMYLLAAGTDGGDGPGPAAGALVDAETVRRGEAAGLDARECLARADAGSFLQASGDLIVTGPTGSNVADVVLGLRWE